MGTFDPKELENVLGASAPANTSVPADTSTFNPDALEAKINAVTQETQQTSKQMANSPSKWTPPKVTSGFDNSIASAALSQVSGIGASIIGGWRGLSELAQGNGFNAAADAIRQEQQNRTYQPDAGSGAAKINSAMASDYNPLNYPAEIGGFVGNKVAKAGYPGIATAIDVGAQFGIPVGVAKGLSMAKGVSVPKGGYAESGYAANELPVKTGTTVPTNIPPGSKVPVTQSVPATTIAAPSVAEKYAPGQVTQEGQPALSNLVQQSDKSQVLNRIGLDTARKSAIEGNGLQAASEAQISKLNSPAGQLIKQQLDKESQALTNHASSIVDSTGGTSGTDNASLINRGQTIAAPFDGLRDYFKQAKANLYNEVDQKIGGNPIPSMDNLNGVFNDPQFKNYVLGKGQQNVVDAIKNQLQEFQAANPNGLTVKDSEAFRQFNNTLWSPDNSSIIGKINGALDQDVAAAGGPEAYQAARAMHQLEMQTLNDPKGISKLFDVDPKTAINRATPFADVPDKLVNLPSEQMQHITDTLKMMQSNPDIPPELKAAAQQSQSEIAAQMANRLLQQGTKNQGGWNAKNVSTEISHNTGKYEQVMTPEQIGMINDLNQAGHILRMDKSYPGAAVQTENLLKQGMVPNIIRLATNRIPLGGSYVGNIAAEKIGEGAAVKKISSGLVNLRDMKP